MIEKKYIIGIDGGGSKTEIVVFDQNGETITKYSDYKEVDGIMYAFKREIQAGPQKIDFEILTVTFNEEISDEFFK